MVNETDNEPDSTDGESNSTGNSNQEPDINSTNKETDKETEWKQQVSQSMSQMQRSLSLIESRLTEQSQRLEGVEADLDEIPLEQTVIVKAEVAQPAQSQEATITQQPITGWRKLVKAILS